MKNSTILLKNILNEYSCTNLSQYITKKFPNFSGILGPDKILTDDYLISPIIKFKSSFKEKYGLDIYVSRDLQLHINRRDNSGKLNGWHIDSAQEIVNCPIFNPYLCNKDYQLYKVGIYLNNNSQDHPCGIDIKPMFWPTNLPLPKLFKLPLALKFSLISLFLFPGKTINTQAGDAFLFDSRIFHRATPALLGSNPTKVAYYFNASLSKDTIDLHHTFMLKMAIFSESDNAHYRRALCANLDTYFSSISEDLPLTFNDQPIISLRESFSSHSYADLC